MLIATPNSITCSRETTICNEILDIFSILNFCNAIAGKKGSNINHISDLDRNTD